MIDQRPELHGEALLWDKLKEYLPIQDIVYNNREINGREFDFCVLLGNSGILIIEVKGWRSDMITVNGVDQITVGGYSTPQRSPKKQARAYRFALLNKIKEKFNISPLVFDMVCYPFISCAEYHAKRLDIVSEAQLTFFQEDLEASKSFLEKIKMAYDTVKNCPHSVLTNDLIAKLRQDWEPHYTVIQDRIDFSSVKHYSSLSVFTQPVDEVTIQQIVNEYFRGTKEIVFVSEAKSYNSFLDAFNRGFEASNIQPNGNNLAIGYEGGLDRSTRSVMTFNLEIELCPDLTSVCSEPLTIIEGKFSDNKTAILRSLSEISNFNFEQYRVEHAAHDHNVLVEAGAGTGKTFSMVSRVAFLCNKNEHAVSNIAEEIGMVTFTNDAASNMKMRLKKMFTNYYVLTGDPKYLKFLEDTDRAHISTIHSFALSILREQSLYTGLGTNFRITTNEYLRNQIYDAKFSEFLIQKEAEDENFANTIPIPVR